MYKVTEERKVIEGQEVTVYGISCGGAAVPDVSPDRAEVEELAEKYNKYGLDPIHLRDAVEDFLSR